MSAPTHPVRRAASSALRGGLTGLAAIAAAVSVPGWVLGLGLGVIAIVVLAQTLFPQESAHRLAWWEARWNRCAHRQSGRFRPPHLRNGRARRRWGRSRRR